MAFPNNCVAHVLDPYMLILTGEVSPDEPQGFHTDRASDRRRDHWYFGRDRDSEVREHEGEGVSRLDEVGSAEPDYGRRGVLRRLGEVHDGDRRGWSAVRDDQRREIGRASGRERGQNRGVAA